MFKFWKGSGAEPRGLKSASLVYVLGLWLIRMAGALFVVDCLAFLRDSEKRGESNPPRKRMATSSSPGLRQIDLNRPELS